MMDATNFTYLNWKAALHNIQQVCPAISCVLQNMCPAPIPLFIRRERTLWSSDGTTQGHPLAIAVFALATSLLIFKLQDSEPSLKLVSNVCK